MINVGPGDECPNEMHVHIYHYPEWKQDPRHQDRSKTVYVDIHHPAVGLLESFAEVVWESDPEEEEDIDL